MKQCILKQPKVKNAIQRLICLKLGAWSSNSYTDYVKFAGGIFGGNCLNILPGF